MEFDLIWIKWCQVMEFDLIWMKWCEVVEFMLQFGLSDVKCSK